VARPLRRYALAAEALAGLRAVRVRAILALAYSRRPCWICGVVGFCRHREPVVELAIAAWRGIGASVEGE
jgi:4'-phosphopantetheinyl transferase EntD